MKLTRSSSRSLAKSSSQGLLVITVKYDRLLDNAANEALKRELLSSKSNVSEVLFNLPTSGPLSEVIGELAASLHALQDASEYTLERDGTYLPRALPMDRFRASVKSGDVWWLQVLPMTRARARIKELREMEASSKKVVFDTAIALKDTAVAECFVFEDGVAILSQVLTSSSSTSNTVGYALNALSLALSTRAGMSIGIKVASELIPRLYRFIADPCQNPSVPANAAAALFAACAPLEFDGLCILLEAAKAASDPSFSALAKLSSSNNVSSALSAINLVAFVIATSREIERPGLVRALQGAGLNEALGLQSNNQDAGISRAVKQVLLQCSRANRASSLLAQETSRCEESMKMAKTQSAEITEQTGLAYDDAAIVGDHHPQRVSSAATELDHLGTCAIIQAEEIVLAAKLGAGSSAIVYRGIWRKRQQIAVKVMLDSKLSFIDMMKEMAVMASFSSDYVLRLCGVVNTPGRSVIAMEFCERGSLHDVLVKEAGTLEWSVALKMLIGAASGLSTLHASKVLHQDVKALNFLVTNEYVCKIGDFGASHALVCDNNSGHSGVLSLSSRPQGTLLYCAPEILLGSCGAACSFESDVYSFGMVMWEVVHTIVKHVYARPYEEYPDLRFDFQLAVQIGSNGLRPTLPEGTPRSFVSLICRAWDDGANKRPDMKDIVKSLEACADNAQRNLLSWISGTGTAPRSAWRRSVQSRRGSVSSLDYE